MTVDEILNHAENNVEIDHAEFQSLISTEVNNILSSIQILRALLFWQGRLASNAYFQTAQNTLFTQEETKIRPRVRWRNDQGGTPSFSWERTIRMIQDFDKDTRIQSKNGKGKSYKAFVRTKSNACKKKVKVVLMSEHVPLLKRTGTISETTFQNEPFWAKVAGMETEQQLALLRQLCRLLGAATTSIKAFDKKRLSERKI